METGLYKEKRNLPRFPLALSADVEPVASEEGKEKRSLLTVNVSSGGVFLYSDKPLPVGTTDKIDLLLPLSKFRKLINTCRDVYVKTSGKVLWSDSTGMAIRFDEKYEFQPLGRRNPKRMKRPHS